MLSRAFTKPNKRNPKHGENSNMSQSIIEEYEDCIVGFMEDFPLILCGRGDNFCVTNSPPTLREVLRASAGVMGESWLGMTEKVVFLGGEVCALKRFREVRLRKLEFGRRIEHVARISRNCEYLVPIRAYLFSKRIKVVLCDYYPMGSLADLLDGGRVYGHTSLEWNQRINIIFNIARAISFIHSHSPPQEKKMQMNVHGSVKSSNIMINIDFSACLSNYGFVQLSECVEVSNTEQRKPTYAIAENKYYCRELSQKSDIYNFGIILFDILGLEGHEFLGDTRKCLLKKKEQIKDGTSDIVFECDVEGKERLQAVEIMEIALCCTDKEPDRRPTIEDVLKSLGNALSISSL